MIRRFPITRYVEVDTETKTVHLVSEVLAASGEGDVVLKREDITTSLAGPANAERRRKMRLLFQPPQTP